MKSFFLVLALLATWVWPLSAKDIDFELVNRSGYTLAKVWIDKHRTQIWGRGLLKAPLQNGASARIWAPNTKGLELPKVARITLHVESAQRWRADYDAN